MTAYALVQMILCTTQWEGERGVTRDSWCRRIDRLEPKDNGRGNEYLHTHPQTAPILSSYYSLLEYGVEAHQPVPRLAPSDTNPEPQGTTPQAN